MCQKPRQSITLNYIKTNQLKQLKGKRFSLFCKKFKKVK